MKKAVLIWAAVAALAGCKRSKPAAPQDASSRPLRVVMYEPKSIDPGKLYDGPGRAIAEDLFEGLAGRTAAGDVRPGCAERWRASEDGLTWTFTLRKGLEWSDGTPLKAADFVYSMRRALAKGTANPQVERLYVLKGARTFHQGDDEALGIAAPDDHTVVLTLERPYPLLPRLVSMGQFLPVPRHAVEKHGDRWTRPEHIVSNGPYLLAAHKHRESMTLEKNPKYWDAAGVAIDEVTLRFTTDISQAWQWFELEEVDWNRSMIPLEKLTELSQKGSEALRVDHIDAVFFLYVNTSKPPLDDKRVRQAISLAIDRPRLTRQILVNREQPATSFLPPGMVKRPPDYSRSLFDAEAARKRLAEAGYGDGKPLPKLKISYHGDPKTRRLMEFVQRNLKDALGVQVDLHQLEWNTFLSQLSSHEYQLAPLLLGGAFDPLEFVELLESSAPNRYTPWSNADFDRLGKAARAARTLKARDAALLKADAVVAEELPVIPLFLATRQNLIRPGLQGYEANNENVHPLRWFRWKGDE